MRHYLINFLNGMFIGIANIIPGVSGGTIAVILGIFDKIIDAINNFRTNIKKSLELMIPIGLGVIFSILIFSSILESCLNKYSLPTNLFFAGLVAGSTPNIYKKSTKNGVKSCYILLTLISIGIVILISTLSDSNQNEIIKNISFIFLFKMFIGGLLASAAMIIPGISGSFVMILLGIYPTVIHTAANIPKCLMNIADKNLLINTSFIVLSLGLGIISGILIISKVISFLLDKFYAITYFCILGLIIGSIYGIFSSPITYQSGINNFMIIASVISFILGTLISYMLGEKN